MSTMFLVPYIFHYNMVTIFLGWILVVVIACCLGKTPKNFPPGPWRLPVVGGLLETVIYPTEMYKRALAMTRRYGKISGYYLGPMPFVFVSGVDEVKEACNMEDFSDRPTGAAGKITQSRRHMLGISLAEGRFWKEQRRFTLRHLRDFGFGKRSMESIIHEEVDSIIQEVKRLAGTSYRNPVCIQDIIALATINVLWHIMSGNRYDLGNPQLKTLIGLVKTWSKNVGKMPDLTLFLPRFKNSTTSNNQLVLRSVKKDIQDFVSETIGEHRETLHPESPRDFIDVYLLEMQKRNSEEINSFSDKQLRAICFDLFIAGSDTTSAALNFCLLYMLLNPDIQKRIQDDLGQGCAILINLWSSHMDNDQWGDPENFRPERFLNEKGELRKMEGFLPFGAGKRSCLGESLARNNLFLFFSGMLQNFSLTIPEGEDPPTTVPEGALNLNPRPFSIKVEPRK